MHMPATQLLGLLGGRVGTILAPLEGMPGVIMSHRDLSGATWAGSASALANIAQYAGQVAKKSLRQSPSCWLVAHWKAADRRVSLEVGPIK